MQIVWVLFIAVSESARRQKENELVTIFILIHSLRILDGFIRKLNIFGLWTIGWTKQDIVRCVLGLWEVVNK